MNRLALIFLAFLGGISLAIQGGLNARLGALLKSPLLASIAGFLSSLLFATLIALLTLRQLPSLTQIKSIPIPLWFLGGLFSALGLTLYYFTIPLLGVSTMISVALCGQLIAAALIAHFGFLGVPVEPFTLKRFIGLLAMGSGILLMNSK